MVNLEKTNWLLCPVCGNKTRDRIRSDTVLINYPLQAGNANQREATEYNNSHRTSHKTDTLPQVAESAGAVNGQDERRINAPPLTALPVSADG